jgi:uncharacterized membrane protein
MDAWSPGKYSFSHTGGFFMNERKDHPARSVALGAVLAAAVTVATMIHVPLPGFRIYFNLGEGVIYTVAILLGGKYGAAAGGIGAAIADLVLGYPLWAPITAVIKGTEGYLVGRLARRNRHIALAAGAAVMTSGYSLTAGVLYGRAAIPVEFATDLLQTGVGAAVALVLVPLLERRILGKTPAVR